MTLSVTGLLAIPAEPHTQIVKPDNMSGFFINFQGVTQGKTTDGKAEYHYWNCSIWIPEKDIEKWEEHIQPGNILYIEHAVAQSFPVLDGKYHNTKIKLDHIRTKKLTRALWSND